MDQRGGNGHELLCSSRSELGWLSQNWVVEPENGLSRVARRFPTRDLLKQQISWVFAPPNQAFWMRSRFLCARQGKKELSAYVQELRTLIATMQLTPLPEMV